MFDTKDSKSNSPSQPSLREIALTDRMRLKFEASHIRGLVDTPEVQRAMNYCKEHSIDLEISGSWNRAKGAWWFKQTVLETLVINSKGLFVRMEPSGSTDMNGKDEHSATYRKLAWKDLLRGNFNSLDIIKTIDPAAKKLACWT